MNNMYKNIIINLNYAKEKRKETLSSKEDNNVNSQLEIFNVPTKLIIDLHTDLAYLSVSLDKDLKSRYTRDILLSNLTRILNRMSDIAIFLDIGLITSVDEIKVNDLENILIELFYNVSMLDCIKETARVRMKNIIIPLFAQLVLSLGFSLTDLRDYYFNKFDSNILKLKNEIKKLLEEFDISEIKRATNILLDEMIEKAQYE